MSIKVIKEIDAAGKYCGQCDHGDSYIDDDEGGLDYAYCRLFGTKKGTSARLRITSAKCILRSPICKRAEKEAENA